MLNIRPLPNDLQEVAIAELNEVPERILDDLKALKAWIQKQPHLRARTDDQFLLAFLRGCEFSMEKAKTKIDRYYALRTQYPEFFTIQDLDSPRVKKLLSYGVGLRLPTPLNENGPRIMLIRVGAYPAKIFTFDEVMSLAHSFEEITLMQDDYAVVNGYIQILDLSNVTTAHFWQMTPTVMKKMSTFQEEATPLRRKGNHFINMPFGCGTIFNMIKRYMPAKTQERLFAHGSNLKTLYQEIPQKYLPTEYGGENGSIDSIIKQSEEMFWKYYDFLKDNNKYGTDEKLRIGKAIDRVEEFD